jgi:hypothetical protein
MQPFHLQILHVHYVPVPVPTLYFLAGIPWTSGCGCGQVES